MTNPLQSIEFQKLKKFCQSNAFKMQVTFKDAYGRFYAHGDSKMNLEFLK